MVLTFTRLSCWLWGTTDHERTNSPLISSSDFPSGFRELDYIKFPTGNGPRMGASSRRMKRKWQSREERRLRIDREYDMVIVPSDGGCLSGSESDDSDWSIGWLEPHADDFKADAGGPDSTFAVLVPCYGRGSCEKKGTLQSHVLGAITDGQRFSSEVPDYIERWLSSLQDM
ncbi:hypothetical protein HPP92_016450 [Vanilla planifolia]|uniref:Uncharacterized protein n=1 Tax=Vanilla planifolia TaxID=51239 RepID=A0A835QG43_VANPL|nr:hypothetical protein HPP92_016977 [Vanilla planifolia]KAG0471904.1 hypothetical protein HPP92_016450 [Vanilla planifolia]